MAKSRIKRYLHTPKFVPKGWGYERWIANGERYCGKLLYIYPNKECSLHFHIKKYETFYLYEGDILITIIHPDGSKEKFRMEEGSSLEIPPGLMHKFSNIHEFQHATIFEFSTQHFDDDSYRIEKGN